MLWDQVELLSKDVIQHLLQFYQNRGLNPQIRAKLSYWIEAWILKSNLIAGCQDHDAKIAWLHTSFLEELDRVTKQLENSNDFLLSVQLAEERLKISNTAPQLWYRNLKECLAEERKFISMQVQQEQEQEGQPGKTNEFNHTSIHRKIREIHSQKENLKKGVNYMLQLQANLRLANQALYNMQTEHINGQQTGNMAGYQAEINDFTTKLATVSNTCMQICNGIMAGVDMIVSKICGEFKQTLQWSCYPVDQFPVLETIQQWYSELLECILDMRDCIFTAGQQESSEDPISFTVPFWGQSAQHLKKLDSAYGQLLSHVLAVRDQPPEVIKTKTKLKLKSEGLTVKLLGKAKFWTANKPLKVQVTVVNEEEAKLLYNTGELTTDMKKNGSKIKNNVGLSKSDGSYSFTNMTITDVHRPTEQFGESGAKKSQGILTSQFCLVFYTILKPITGESIEVWCCSRPFVAIVGDGQLQEAYGIVLWDSMHESPRVPFVLPKTAPWSRVAWALNRYVQTRTKITKKSPTDPEPPVWSLTPRNLQVLGEKLFGHGTFNESTLVPAEKFLTKDGQKCFWDWFYKAVELLEHHLKKHWNSGHIIGFINRRDAESLLQTLNNPGSFIIRFSDSVHGAISICSYSPWDLGQLFCKNLGPVDEKELDKLDIVGRLAGPRYETVVHESCEAGQITQTRKIDAFPKQDPGPRVPNGYERIELAVQDPFDSNLSMSPTESLLAQIQNNIQLFSPSAYMNHFPASPPDFVYPFSTGMPDQNQIISTTTPTGNTTDTDVVSMAVASSISLDPPMDI